MRNEYPKPNAHIPQEIIRETNQSKPWIDFNTYDEYFTQTENQSAAQILKAKEYFAKELIREEILKTLNQDPFTYTSKLGISARIQPLSRYKSGISPFNGPLFNQLILIENPKESFTFYNEEKQFSLKTIMIDQIQKGYDNLHEMLNHDQLKLNFIVIDGAIAVGKTTTCNWLKAWLQSYEQNVILREEITLQHKDLLNMFYANPEKYVFALQITIINEWNLMYQQLYRLQLEGKIPNGTYIIEDRTVYSTQFFTEEIITDQKEKEKLNQLLQHSTFKLLQNKMNYTIFCDPGQEQMLQWFEKRSKEGNKGTDKQIPKDYLIKIYNKYKEMIKQVHPNYIRINNNIPNLEHMFRTLFIYEMNTNFEEYNEEKIYRLQEHWDCRLEPQLTKIPIKSYTVFIPFTLQNQVVKILTAQRLNVTIYPNQFETLGGSIEETDKGIFEAAKRECKEETSYKPEDKRMQLILNHQYLSNNKNRTQLFIEGIHKHTQIEKRIQIYTFLYYNILQVTIILLIAAIQIITPDNINVTVPVVTVTQTPMNAPSSTTLLITQTVIQMPSTNYFNDINAVNTLVAELITIAIPTIVITCIIYIKKRNTKLLKEQIQCLATTQSSRPPDYFNP
ncbi:18395_t:CDS:2 [Gigaspora margarita]|uniref:18395_t:CDS:1 n=1 Tax=Gigaspora margarita TaxID=4874 RepID=A0ABN7UTN9_GIGMA|nr:18395_t:CDS:2 [Gigaspora margarita]